MAKQPIRCTMMMAEKKTKRRIKLFFWGKWCKKQPLHHTTLPTYSNEESIQWANAENTRALLSGKTVTLYISLVRINFWMTKMGKKIKNLLWFVLWKSSMYSNLWHLIIVLSWVISSLTLLWCNSSFQNSLVLLYYFTIFCWRIYEVVCCC